MNFGQQNESEFCNNRVVTLAVAGRYHVAGCHLTGFVLVKMITQKVRK